MTLEDYLFGAITLIVAVYVYDYTLAYWTSELARFGAVAVVAIVAAFVFTG